MDTSFCNFTSKPVMRSALRKLIGRLWYRYLRYFQWYFSGTVFARTRSAAPLPYICTGHSTPLIRKLAGADMWLQQNKITNLRLAAARLNGIVVKPGETLSFWKLVGKPTKRKGYLPGMVLTGGTVKPGIGGGLCQMANLIYWMTLHTELTVTERHRHSYDVFPDSNRTQPFGSGATCSYNHLDLQITNNTDAPYQLNVELVDGYLQGTWRSGAPSKSCYKVYERDARILPNAWGGYFRHNAIWRTTRDETGKVICDEKVCENNALMMYAPLLPQGGQKAQCTADPFPVQPVETQKNHPILVARPQYQRNALQGLYH